MRFEFRRHLIAIASCFAAFLGGTIALQDPKVAPPANQQQDTLEGRVAGLERRVALLEKLQLPATTAKATPPEKAAAVAKDGEFWVDLTITNKRYNPERLHESIMFDVSYDFAKLTKDARAIKGTLVFSDLFGEPKFAIGNTLTDPVKKGSTFSQSGIGFEFNQFRDSHTWMLVTELKDMKATFRVDQVIYDDGSKAEFK